MGALPPQHQAAVTTQHRNLHSSTDDKGKIESAFSEPCAPLGSEHLGDEGTKSLEALNRSLWAWVEGEYHQSLPIVASTRAHPARAMGARRPQTCATPDPTLDLDDLFLFEAKRRVMKDRTVSLQGRLYEVDALLVGQTVTLRYDPQAPPSRPIQVRP